VDKPREECGIVGVFNHPEAARTTYFGLHALQHRGQESAGIVTSTFDESRGRPSMPVERDFGLVLDVFDDEAVFRDTLLGDKAIGHTRYSTSGSATNPANIQPFVVHYQEGNMALAHNGNLSNARSIRDHLVARGTLFNSSSDTELLLHLVAQSDEKGAVPRIIDALHRAEGAFSLVILTDDELIAVRDPNGFRPLALGRIPRAAGRDASGWIVASETCAFDIVGAEYVRDVEPGEIVVLEAGQPPRSVRYAAADPTLCVFELIYFARPDSYMEGRNLYEVRRRMGEQLAWEHPVDADLVMPVPDTGAPAAAGYAEASGLPYREGMYRNRYAGRTFIQPSQGMRHRGVTIKLNPLREVVAGKRLVVVDDSIVRGTTTKRIVELLRKAGAREVHVRISAPPIFHPCFYGIDTSIETELIASTHSEPEIRDFIGADSLGYLSIRGVLAALDLPYERFCFACFDGNYPEPVPYDTASRKFVLEEAVGAGRG
jgi:amidophosphoribosyltransferase